MTEKHLTPIIIPVTDKAVSKLITEVNDKGEIPLTDHKKKLGNHYLYRALEGIENINQQILDAMKSLDDSFNDLSESIKDIGLITFTKKKHNNRRKTHLKINEKVKVIKDDKGAVTLHLTE